MNADGSEQVRVVTPGSAVAPRWSPDGSRIVFYSRFPAQDPSISLINADGTGLVQLLRTAYEGGPLDSFGSGADWSPDGSKIVFPGRLDGAEGLYVMNIDGTGLVKITSGGNKPDWGLNNLILFEHSPVDENRELWTVAPDGSGLTRLTNSESDEVGGRWSPDGTQIIFTYLTNIYVSNADGSNPQQIGIQNEDESLLAWSKDGSKILFTAYDHPCPCSNNEVWIMNSDGTGRSIITNNSAHDNTADWRWD